MSILLSSTLANESTPYYALAGGAGGNFIPAITNTTSLVAPWGAVGAGYPLTPASGVVVGQTYVAPRTGTYLCEVAMGFNVGPSAVVVGTGDLVVVGIARTDLGFSISGAGTLQPYNMPSTGADYSIRTSFNASFVAGGTYTLFWYVVPTSGTLNLAEANGSCGISILPLC
jgi:hypothetical protein